MLWGAQKKKSDLDVLVEFYRTIDLFTFVELEDFLSEVPGVKVDPVMKSALKPRIKDRRNMYEDSLLRILFGTKGL
jgi:predicted nucleotidyltransferase